MAVSTTIIFRVKPHNIVSQLCSYFRISSQKISKVKYILCSQITTKILVNAPNLTCIPAYKYNYLRKITSVKTYVRKENTLTTILNFLKF